jgi:hypothetical protein
MPVLKNLRHEAFAQARAKGALLDDAYEDAGFVGGYGHGSRLASLPDVAERIAELRAGDATIDESSVQAVIAALLALAQSGKNLANASGLKESRLALLDASRLREELAQARRGERWTAMAR